MGFYYNIDEKQKKIYLPFEIYNNISYDNDFFDDEKKIGEFTGELLIKLINNTQLGAYSIKRRDFQNEFYKLLSKYISDKTLLSKISVKLADNEIQKIKNQYVSTKKNGTGKNITLNMNNDLKGLIEASLEDKEYGNNYKDYFETILKEYGSLPFIERERIYLKSDFEKLESYKKKKVIEFYWDKTLYEMRPYILRANPDSRQYYLIGYAKSEKSKKFEIQSFLIPYMEKIREKSNFPKEINLKEELDNINSRIDENKGIIQHSHSKIVTVKVQFTDKGLAIQKRQKNQYIRDFKCIDKENNIYTFSGPNTQIWNYLMIPQYRGPYEDDYEVRFEILEPVELRDKFVNIWTKLAERYKKSEA